MVGYLGNPPYICRSGTAVSETVVSLQGEKETDEEIFDNG